MYIKKIIALISFTLVLFLTSTYTIRAEPIYSDNFDDGNSDGWIISYNTCSSGWQVNNYKYGIIINGGCVTETIPQELSISPDINYSFEVKMTMPQSINMDRNFVFKYQDHSNWYGIHTLNNNLYLHKVVNGTEYFLENWHTNYNFLAGETYDFKIDKINNRFDIYINDVFHISVPNSGVDFDNQTAGLQASAGGSPTSEVWFDNVVVTELPDEEEETLPVLTVPDLKQYSLPWKNKMYDHKKASIEKFGCALTSASMVLQYHGHNIMPDVLNNWLKNQPDGYLKNGLVNWLAISRYTKENYSPQSRTLEYKRLEGTFENLDSELNNDRPAILKEPGHFVVATGKTADTYLINDPGYSDRTDLSSYDNNFLKINSYTPTDSDLSYMMFVTDPDINLEIASSSGLIIPTDSYIEDPITNLLNPDKKSGNPVKIYLFEKPETGKYILKATGPKGKYNLESYLYNTNGKVTKNSFDGRLNGNDTDTFNISFEGKNKIKEADKKPYFRFFKKHFWKNWW